MRVLVTGGAGFIGSHFVRHLLANHPDYQVTVLDKLTYAGRMENLQDVHQDIQFIQGDICNSRDVERAMTGCRLVFNFAAESHVDRSIDGGGIFVQTNVQGTYILLEQARRLKMDRYIQVSTDEVYGSSPARSFVEGDVLNPSSPYSASKASADLFTLAQVHTHGLPAVITRSTNVFGPHQFPEKLIPVLILNAIEGLPLPIYGDGRNVRDWIYVTDNCAAIDFVAHHGRDGEVYNVGGKNERRNVDVAGLVLDILERPRELIQFVPDRPGHDLRYSLDTSKLERLGWHVRTNFEDRLRDTVAWYRQHEWWWQPLREHGSS